MDGGGAGGGSAAADGGLSGMQFCIMEISLEENPVRNALKNMHKKITGHRSILHRKSGDGHGKMLSFIRIRAGIITGY